MRQNQLSALALLTKEVAEYHRQVQLSSTRKTRTDLSPVTKTGHFSKHNPGLLLRRFKLDDVLAIAPQKIANENAKSLVGNKMNSTAH